MIEEISRFLAYIAFGLAAAYLGLLVYDALFRPWRLVEAGLSDIKKQLELLDGRFARLHAFMIAPWLRGDVEKTRKFLRMMEYNKRRELVTYLFVKEGS